MARKKKKPLRSVELLDAFMWLCPECANKNFVVAVTIEMSDSEKKEYFDLEEWEETPPGNFSEMPQFVTCGKCKEKFASDLGLDDEETYDKNDKKS